MYMIDPGLTAGQVVVVFRHELPYLFLAAAFVTVGLVAEAFALLGRRVNRLMVWFGLFAIVYGVRHWLNSESLVLMLPHSRMFLRLRAASTFVVPIPAFFYFEAAGFLNRYGKRIAYTTSVIFFCLMLGTLLLGPLRIFETINSVIVIAALVALVYESARKKQEDHDFAIVRRGLLVFAAAALASNLSDLLGHFLDVEPLAFAFFLGTLGFVAARRMLHRDQELAEVQKELEVARRIQMGNLPAAYPNSTRFKVATRYVPMTSVAGDFYDFVVADEQQAGLLIADVSGHGVPAALIASMVKLAASVERGKADDPAALLQGMNTALCGNTHGQFVTAAYVYLDASAGTLHYAAAAHPPMLLVRDGLVTEIVENGLLLAAFSFATFTTTVQPLLPGDRLILYTDGIIEAANAQQEEFGQERLQALLRGGRAIPADDMADRVIAAVQGWSKTQDDDLTVLICDYAGPPGKGAL